MFELRWKIHDVRKDGPPPQFAIDVGMRHQTQYRVLQYKTIIYGIDASGALNVLPGPNWTDWKDIPVSQ